MISRKPLMSAADPGLDGMYRGAFQYNDGWVKTVFLLGRLKVVATVLRGRWSEAECARI